MIVDITAFAGDCIIRGRLDLTADRVSDQLNAELGIHLVDVVLEDLDTGHEVMVPTFSIPRDDVCAVSADGPRGSRQHRVATSPRRLQAQIGPYTALGRLHAVPGVDPLQGFASREPMVPLTDATIAWVVAGILEVRDVTTLIVNRELTSWIRAQPDGRPATGRHLVLIRS